MSVTIQDLDAAREAAKRCLRLLDATEVVNLLGGKVTPPRMYELATAHAQARQHITPEVVDAILTSDARHDTPVGESDVTTWHELANRRVLLLLMDATAFFYDQTGDMNFFYPFPAALEPDEMKKQCETMDAEDRRALGTAWRETLARDRTPGHEGKIDREWAATRAAIEQANGNKPPTGKPPTITDPEADYWARKLAADDPQFVKGSKEQWAAAITKASGKYCSAKRAYDTPFFQEELDRQGKRRGRARGKGRSGSRSPAKAASLTSNVEASQGDRTAGDPLEHLLAQEHAELIAKAERAVHQSSMDETGRRAAIEQLYDGTQTPEKTLELAKMFPPTTPGKRGLSA